MKSQRHWYDPSWQRERERTALEREATKLIRNADRRREASRHASRRQPPPRETPALPRKLTLQDLELLRKRGLLP